ncbi:maleylpyruvate isomerase family mycothiol-dependent enzyme [Actinoplanes sp. NEAU-A12]|uniref:Maleylpyruvate isomerase family mycothiol-dependent enzyme n=1 Tax=Actinoplanes sandaracinus TaxID=3045177 RepID=A0ABT6WI30_9ACTN|nr:maleylpyruvate isomerase family mycothiol-dependent enzyme [Actinoplanes sandaracinus]MDI6099389.1 maleylpyruvate isomerase family mycothiol-dependent enzyme [Actinoplanes sandaracinus]
MTVQRATVWSVVHEERATLCRDLATLAPEQWSAPTACTGWDVHDVVAHLVDSAKATRLGFVRDMLAARGDFDRQNAFGVARERRDDPRDTLRAFRSVVTRTSAPPAPVATRLVEAFVHGEDIRRAVGLRGDYPPGPVVTALAHQLRTTVRMGGGKELAAGLRLVASDAPLDTGSGPEVRGPAIALLLAVSGRAVEPGELTGPGVTVLAERAAS